MKLLLWVSIFFFASYVQAQQKSGRINTRFDETEKYISLNLFSVAEPQFAFGPSFGIRFTERSEIFAEAAYVAKTPFYKNDWEDYSYLRGARVILQYRYHFLQQWRPLFNFGLRNRRIRSRHQPFMGVEFRVKPIFFSTSASFVNQSTNDTLYNYVFKANAFTYGGALIFGNTFNLSRDEKWKLEFTLGIGAKQRVINKTTIPEGYKRPQLERAPFQRPPLYEELGTILIPCAIRLRLVLD
jgi:hypothetical protein